MAQRSVYDPHDPWAFRNTWTGEIRNSYDDLWIWMTLIIGLTLLALCVLVPILIHIYCKDACFCLESFRCYKLFLAVCYRMSSRRKAQHKTRAEWKAIQRPDVEEEYVEAESEQPNKDEKLERHVTFHPMPRSYPASYYPRSGSLPPPPARVHRKRYHSVERRVDRVDIPRLKLK